MVLPLALPYLRSWSASSQRPMLTSRPLHVSLRPLSLRPLFLILIDEKALAYQGDAAINANSRKACSTWSRANISTYCYRFDVTLHDQNTAQQGNELPFVFANTDELGVNTDKDLVSLAHDISSTWVSFIATLDPNAWRQQAANVSAVTPTWPKYAAG